MKLSEKAAFCCLKFNYVKNSPPLEGWIRPKVEDGVVLSSVELHDFKIKRAQTTPSKILSNFRHPSKGGEFHNTVYFYTLVAGIF
jgi:hypothetical protein